VQHAASARNYPKAIGKTLRVKPKVLIVDDEELSQDFLQRVLGNQYAFDHASDGASAISAAAAGRPDVILMDVEMPGMNGYDACRAIKDDPATAHIPVFFVSAHSAAQDRLKAYKSGGDDYVAKPFNPEELKHKIALALASQRKRNELAEKGRYTTSMAMTSLREAASAGAALGFLSDIVRQTEREQIAETTLHTLQRFHSGGAVQLRDGANHLSRSSTGACTPVEEAVLAKMAGENRIVDIGKRTAFNYERATIIVYDMPVDDPELYGRMKDTIVKMAEALDIHMRSLEVINGAHARGERLFALLKDYSAVSRDVGARLKMQREALQQLARENPAAAHDTLAQCQALEKTLDAMAARLDEALKNETAAAPPPAVTRFNSVELF